MSTSKYLVGTLTTVITTGLDSLATTGTATSSAIDNSTDGNLYVDVELNITFGGGAPTTKSRIECYLVESVDGGSTYEDVPPAGGLIGAWILEATTSAQKLLIRRAACPPGFYKVHVVAKTTGATANSSGNTVKILPYTEQQV